MRGKNFSAWKNGVFANSVFLIKIFLKYSSGNILRKIKLYIKKQRGIKRFYLLPSKKEKNWPDKYAAQAHK